MQKIIFIINLVIVHYLYYSQIEITIKNFLLFEIVLIFIIGGASVLKHQFLVTDDTKFNALCKERHKYILNKSIKKK